ncbi:MAG: hypothetical protein H7Z38_09040 [Rubrivivax sp.]|nr:hypothetical protein [Pyrinomonadaceae bacterium]
MSSDNTIDTLPYGRVSAMQPSVERTGAFGLVAEGEDFTSDGAALF